MSDHDQLRQKLADVLAEHFGGYSDATCGCGDGYAGDVPHLTDALLPVIDAHVQAELERIAQAIHAHADKGGVEPNFEFGLRFAADRIVRGGAA